MSCQTEGPVLVNSAVQCDIGNMTVDLDTDAGNKTLISTGENISPDYSFWSTSSQVTDSQTSDRTYRPSQSTSNSDTDRVENSLFVSSDRKFLVYESHLDKLFSYCSICNHTSQVTKHALGSCVAVTQFCMFCDRENHWTSQPMIGDLPAGNIHLSAAIYFSGASFAKVARVLSALNVQGISSATYYRHCDSFLQPTVLSFWHTHQLELIRQIASRTGEVVVAGDMRADSPGHCAKYGSYTMLEVRSNKIIDVQLVQSNEVGGSSRMEKEGLVRSIKFLEENGLLIDKLITDRHPQIQKYLRDMKPSITHYYDVWHVAKALRKKLEALGKERECKVVQEWIKSIVNHLYWSAASSSTGEEAVAKWVSVANHIQNVHEHENWLFPICLHGDVSDRNWLQPSTKACEKLTDIVVRKQLLADIAKLSPDYQTSSVEGFHSLILKFAPKNLIFSFKSMLCRLYLAALHFNENSNRDHRVNAAGEPVQKVRFPKFKHGGHSVVLVKESPSFDYVDELLTLLFNSVLKDPTDYQQHINDIVVPAPLCSEFQRPTVSVIRSRFCSYSEP